MHSALRTGRRLATILTSIGLAALVASSSVLASTPVTVGYRDQEYGGGAFRPASDKPQSKLWFTDNTWYAGMFYLPSAHNRIWRLDESSQTWVATSTIVDLRDMSHADYLWDEGTQTLYVISTPPIPNTVPAAPVSDGIQVYKYTYDAATNTYAAAAGFATPKVIQNTTSDGAGSSGGAPTVTIAIDTTGDLWAAWPRDGLVKYSKSEDGGATWSDPAMVPSQGANTIKSSVSDEANDTVAVLAFGSRIGVMWSDHDGIPAAADNGFYFSFIDAGGDPTSAGNWTLEELPSLVATTDRTDNHVNVKATSDGSVYMVGKMHTDTLNCATNKQRPLIPFFARTPGAGGTWSTHLAGTVGDCNTRPQVVISEELDTAYLFMTSPNGGGTIYRKSAPLSGPDAFDFRGAADQTIQRGTPFIQSAQETQIDDPSTTKQSVSAASGIVVIGSNITSTRKFYLHNQMPLAATDSAPPTGTSVSINGGAATTNSQTVSVAVPASDAGSGVSLVRLSNNSDMSASTTYTYMSPISWTLSAGFGTKTVYVEWRDSAGNWSAAPSTDTINYAADSTPPSPPASVSHRIFGSGRYGIPIRIEWPAAVDNSGGSGIKEYRVTKSVNGGAATTIATVPEGPTRGVSLDLPNSAITYRFCVYAIDNNENESTSARCSASFKTISYSESSTAMKYSGTWSLSSSSVYIGGKARISSTRNSSVSLSFNGNRVGWYSRLGPTLGQARVYIDGSLNKTVNLNAATVFDRKLVFTKSWSAIGNHSIRIVVVGTSGHPKVVVDQIFVLR